MPFSRHDTIVALATPPGQSGLGVVRLSGPQSTSILMRVWKGKKLEARRLSLGEVVNLSGDVIDKAMAVFLPAPHTYTGDDIVEVSCHGSPFILEKLVLLCIEAGARLAQPGEFTRRAYLSGKLDLAQAEAVVDVIHATSEASLRSAQEQLQGRLSHEVKTLHDELLNLRAFVEATIDFPEEDIDMIEREGIATKLLPLIQRLESFLSTFHRGRLVRDGVSVALVGKPNVGKSSLLNTLSGSERAIVHEIPGTTRDVIEVAITIEGMLFHLVDTAGIHATDEAIERIGIERSRQAIERADLVLVICDGSMPQTHEDEEIFSLVKEKQHLLCWNKCDLLSKTNSKCLPMRLSAKTGEGIENLFSALCAFASSQATDGASITITNLRHQEALLEASKALHEAQASIQRRESAEFCAHHLRQAQEALQRIIGLDVSEELLDRIFSGFCIGK